MKALAYLFTLAVAASCKFVVDVPPSSTTSGQPPTQPPVSSSHDSTPPTPPPSGGSVALDFSLGSIVTVPLSPELLPQAFTVELWLKPRSAAGGYRQFLVGAWGDSGRASLALTLERGHLSFLAHDAIHPTSFFVGPLLRDTVWQHVAASFSGGTATLFVNGAAAGSAAVVTPATCCPARFTLGRETPDDVDWGGWQYFGALRDVRVWSTARSAADIAASMHTAVPSDAPGLVSYWPLNEGSGSLARDATGKHNGAISGGVWTAP